MLVDIDVTKPRIRGTNICFEGKKQEVAFKCENFSLFCFYCGRIRHGERICEHKVQDVKREELEEGQFGEWVKAYNVSLGSKGRLWERKDKGAGREREQAVLGLVEMRREKRRQYKGVQQDATRGKDRLWNKGMRANKLVEDGNLGEGEGGQKNARR